MEEKIIKVKISWDFEFDAEGFDSEFIDIEGLAKDSAFRELQYLFTHNSITEDEFIYECEEVR